MLYDGDTFECNGRTFRLKTEWDDSGNTPWDREDGHGPVTDWTRRAKRPGERILKEDRGAHRYYDFEEAVKIAARDGWDTPPYMTGTVGERAARAAEADYQRLLDWCNDRWNYIGVIVEHIDSGRTESLWGIESDAGDYLQEVARELAGQINHELDNEMATAIAESRPDMAST